MMEQAHCDNPDHKKKILYAASTASHLQRFHMPYLDALRKDFEVVTAANGEDADISLPFEKKMLSPKNLKVMFRIRNILKREQFDGVILNTSLAAFLIRLAAVGMNHRPKILNIVHGYLFHEPPAGKKDRLMLFCEKLVRRQTDAIAVMNREDLEIAKKYRLTNGKISFIKGMGYRFPATPPKKDLTLRTRLLRHPSDFVLLFVGELSHRKNQIFLIRSVKALLERNLPVSLILVGEGSERSVLEQEIVRLHLEDRVILTGNQEPVFPYLAAADLYVSASRIEGLPFNLMEAMAAGLPAVVSDVKGQSDLMADTPKSLYPLSDTAVFCEKAEQVYRSGSYGIGSTAYPALEQYRLERVCEENTELMKGFLQS